jgi:hypothetical protein
LEELLQDILYQELKPRKKVLTAAAKTAYDLSSVEATLLADAILRALAFCRIKSKSMTSGAKLPQAVVNIINLLKKLGNARLGTQLRVGAYKLAQEQPEDSPVLPCHRQCRQVRVHRPRGTSRPPCSRRPPGLLPSPASSRPSVLRGRCAPTGPSTGPSPRRKFRHPALGCWSPAWSSGQMDRRTSTSPGPSSRRGGIATRGSGSACRSHPTWGLTASS